MLFTRLSPSWTKCKLIELTCSISFQGHLGNPHLPTPLIKVQPSHSGDRWTAGNGSCWERPSVWADKITDHHIFLCCACGSVKSFGIKIHMQHTNRWLLRFYIILSDWINCIQCMDVRCSTGTSSPSIFYCLGVGVAGRLEPIPADWDRVHSGQSIAGPHIYSIHTDNHSNTHSHLQAI